MHFVQEDPPIGTPSDTIQIDPDEGFGPHLVDGFLDLYGEDSVFVTATVDCLTWRFTRVLILAERLPPDAEAPQYGPPEMREALESLLQTLARRGLEKPSVTLMRSAVGREDPGFFHATASSLLGGEAVANWLHLVELEDYAGAKAPLASQ